MHFRQKFRFLIVLFVFIYFKGLEKFNKSTLKSSFRIKLESNLRQIIKFSTVDPVKPVFLLEKFSNLNKAACPLLSQRQGRRSIDSSFLCYQKINFCDGKNLKSSFLRFSLSQGKTQKKWKIPLFQAEKLFV